MAKAANITEATTKAPEPAMVSITVEDAEQILELFNGVVAADNHFHTCQSVNFRDHIKGVYKAQKVAAAFDRLKEKIVKAKEV